MPGVSEQRLDRSSFSGGVEPVHAVERGKIDLEGLDRRAERAEVPRRVMDGRLIGGDQQIEPVFGAAFSQLIADAGRRSGDDGEWTCV